MTFFDAALKGLEILANAAAASGAAPTVIPTGSSNAVPKPQMPPQQQATQEVQKFNWTQKAARLTANCLRFAGNAIGGLPAVVSDLASPITCLVPGIYNKLSGKGGFWEGFHSFRQRSADASFTLSLPLKFAFGALAATMEYSAGIHIREEDNPFQKSDITRYEALKNWCKPLDGAYAAALPAKVSAALNERNMAAMAQTERKNQPPVDPQQLKIQIQELNDRYALELQKPNPNAQLLGDFQAAKASLTEKYNAAMGFEEIDLGITKKPAPTPQEVQKSPVERLKDLQAEKAPMKKIINLILSNRKDFDLATVLNALKQKYEGASGKEKVNIQREINDFILDNNRKLTDGDLACYRPIENGKIKNKTVDKEEIDSLASHKRIANAMINANMNPQEGDIPSNPNNRDETLR